MTGAPTQTQAIAEEVHYWQRRCLQAERNGRDKTRYLAEVSHELREPMNAVLGMTRLLAESELSAPQKEYVAAIEEGGRALLSIVNDVIDLERIEAAQLALDDRPFAPRGLFRSVFGLIETRAAAKGLQACVDLHDSLPEQLQGDPGRLRQITLNLLGNALKFTESGTIALRVHAEPVLDERTRLTVVVDDSGPGMAADLRARVFDAFVQGGSDDARVRGGSGLGLAITARLCALMDGTIACLPGPGGKGSRFVVRLPMQVPAPAQPTDTAPRPELGSGILIVEPDSHRVARLSGPLRSAGFRVQAIADSNVAACHLADPKSDIGLVLLACHRDSRTWQASAQALRASCGDRPLRLVLLAVAGFRGDAAAARRAGFDGYLSEPLRPAVLLRAVSDLLGARHDDMTTRHSARAVRPLRPLDVLLADDHPLNRRLAELLLERAGHRVTSVDSGEEAVRAARGRAFDVIIMDVRMPGMGGLEASRQIRADRTAKWTPIIALTANAATGDDEACFAAGMDDVLTKPVRQEALLYTVEEWGRVMPPPDGSG